MEEDLALITANSSLCLYSTLRAFSMAFFHFGQIRKQGQAIFWKAYARHQCLLAKPGVPKVPCSQGTS